ncbi:MAG: HDOD domain-containing protein [Sedimenticola sp.]|nr:HDOD domain-containing protein [Sedimenticola sp.]
MESDKSRVERAVLQTRHLPPLSMTANRLLQAVSDDDIDLRELSAIIEQDPGLAARIIGLANSAYFSQPTPVYSVEEAIIRVLGLNMVKSLALGITVAGAFQVERCPVFDIAGYWYEALMAGQLLGSLVTALPVAGRPDPNALYLAGLFHNLGILLLVHLVPDLYAAVVRQVPTDPDRLLVAEREQLGVDHREAGAWLAGKWHLPEVNRELMAFIGRDDYKGTYSVELRLLNGATEWVARSRRGEVSDLPENRWLKDLEGIDPKRLSMIEDRFRKQMDELELIARQLA